MDEWKYPRKGIVSRTEIHSQFGGTPPPQGISCSRKYPFIFLFCSERGRENSGYLDKWTPEGSFLMYGEGLLKEGGMTMDRGNKAVLESQQNGKRLFLFDYRGLDRWRFEGEMVLLNTSESDEGDKHLIIFELSPVENLEDDDSLRLEIDVTVLRERAYQSINANPREKETATRYRERSVLIKEYIRHRAGGTCEGCHAPAPFLNKEGKPFLEIHHITRLSDNGPDEPRNMIALCPNCHRRAHFSLNRGDFNDAMLEKVRDKEKSEDERK